MSQLKTVIEESFTQYAGAVLQSRALIDVRDGLKPSARQIFYSMLLHKLTSKNPHKKTANAVGMAMADFYIHGDSSCEGVIMRAGQPFAMRYPLIDVKGNAGTLIESGNWAAVRYTESRLSKISNLLFEDIEKDTISNWRDSYDNSKQYPSVLPSKGFYNIVNGSQGIGVGMASSIPQFNLKELNNALIYLIDNPDCDFEDIYCAPDFATGAILYNEPEVKQAMKKGTGFACKLRSVVDYDARERCFVVTEIPYAVYTNTICRELEEIINGEDNPGVERFNDLTGTAPLIKIYLQKKANPDKVLKYLYKNTSLQYYYGINFTMLDQGRYPKVFTWKEMLQAHIDHEREIYRKSFEFDLKKIEDRIHIIDGLLICMANIDDVVQTIKTSESTAAASTALQEKFMLDATQAKAVLDMKLSRLARLEVKKLENEKVELQKESEKIHNILENEEVFKEQLKNGWREVSRTFGDERRTKIITLAEGNDSEVIEQRRLSVVYSNAGAVQLEDINTLYSQRRNGSGTKFKLDKEEYIIDNLVGDNVDTILFFTSHGNYYHAKLNDFTTGEKQYLSNFFTLLPYEHVVSAAIISKQNQKKHILFVTKKGIIKKSELSEYNLKRNAGATAINLDEGDEIISILFITDENIGITSRSGNFIMITTKDIHPIGRVARGVIGMKLDEGDEIVSAKVIPKDTTELISVTQDGYIKRSSISEFRITGRATKGVKIQKTSNLCDFLPITNNNDVLIVSSNSQIRLKLSEIPLLGRGTQGVKTLKLTQNSKIIKINTI